MTCTWIKNGTIKLVIRPDDEIEAAMLKELMKQPIEGTSVATMQVGDIQYANAVIITPMVKVIQ